MRTSYDPSLGSSQCLAYAGASVSNDCTFDLFICLPTRPLLECLSSGSKDFGSDHNMTCESNEDEEDEKDDGNEGR